MMKPQKIYRQALDGMPLSYPRFLQVAPNTNQVSALFKLKDGTTIKEPVVAWGLREVIDEGVLYTEIVGLIVDDVGVDTSEDVSNFAGYQVKNEGRNLNTDKR